MGKLNAVEQQQAVMEGIQKAWDFHLSQHPVSTTEAIEDSVAKAFTSWLDANRADVLAAIAKANTPPEAK